MSPNSASLSPGTLKVTMDGKRHEARPPDRRQRARASTMRLLVTPKKRLEESIDQLGLSSRQLEPVKGADRPGWYRPGQRPDTQGLTTTLYGIIRGTRCVSHAHPHAGAER